MRDVAYRLVPETDLYGMIGDVKRALAWMKTNGSTYGVDPDKIALGGGSAGCHLALLELPWAEYLFDLVFPQISPAARSAIYDVDRFLGWLANGALRSGGV